MALELFHLFLDLARRLNKYVLFVLPSVNTIKLKLFDSLTQDRGNLTTNLSNMIHISRSLPQGLLICTYQFETTGTEEFRSCYISKYE